MNTENKSFAERVDEFVTEAFSPEGARSIEERTHRFLEEAIELAQSSGCTQDEAHQLVTYVFGRPVGAAYQEAGGVMLTLHALCTAIGLHADRCGEVELERAKEKIDVIRQKHLSKPRRSPLPGQADGAIDAISANLAKLGSLATGGLILIEIESYQWRLSRDGEGRLLTLWKPGGEEEAGWWTLCTPKEEALMRSAIRGGARVVKAGEA